MGNRQLNYALEVSEAGVHYYSASSVDEKIELQIAVHKSGAVSKITLVTGNVNSTAKRTTVTRDEFLNVFSSVAENFRHFIDVDKNEPFNSDAIRML